jgi:putative endonuclease
VYILATKRNGTLYTGVTSNLPQRLYQHQYETMDGFTKYYHVHRLVYYEDCGTMEAAIAREKQIKAGSRKKKLKLIEGVNPTWRDLKDDI